MLRILTSKRLFYLFLFLFLSFLTPVVIYTRCLGASLNHTFPPSQNPFFGARTPYCNITILYKSLIFMFSIIDSFVFVGFDFGFGSV